MSQLVFVLLALCAAQQTPRQPAGLGQRVRAHAESAMFALDSIASRGSVETVTRPIKAPKTYRLGVFVFKPIGNMANACGKGNETKACVFCSRSTVSQIVLGPQGTLWWFRTATQGKILLTATDKDIIELPFSEMAPEPTTGFHPGTPPFTASFYLFNMVKKLWGKDPLRFYDRVVYVMPGLFHGKLNNRKRATATAFMSLAPVSPKWGFDIMVAGYEGCPRRSFVHELMHTFGCGHATSMVRPKAGGPDKVEQYGDTSTIMGNLLTKPELQTIRLGLTSPCYDFMGLLDGKKLLKVAGQSAAFRLNNLNGNSDSALAATFTTCKMTFYISWKERAGVDLDLGNTLFAPDNWAPGIPMSPEDQVRGVPSGPFLRTLMVHSVDPLLDKFGQYTRLEAIVPLGHTVESNWGFRISHGPNLGQVVLETTAKPCTGTWKGARAESHATPPKKWYERFL